MQTSLISGQVLDFDVLTAMGYPLDLVQEGFTPAFLVKAGQDVAGRQISLDTAGTLPLVRLGHLFVERTVSGHAAAPLGGGAMKRQPGHEGNEPGVAPPQDLDG